MQPAGFETEQTVHRAVEEIAVVGDHDHATAEVFEKVLQHAQRLHIQIVGGLIEQQHIRSLNQHPAKGQAPPLAPGEFGQGAVLLRWWKQKPLQQLRGGELLASEVDAAGSLLHEFDDLALQSLALGEVLGVLVQIADVDGFPKAQGAVGGTAATGDQIQQRGFAAAVRADDPHPVLGAEAVGEVIQKPPAFGTAVGADPQSLGFDHQFADASADAGHLQFSPGQHRLFFPHGFDALQASLLLCAACFRALAQPGQFPPQHPLELGRRGGFGRLLFGLVLQVGAVVALIGPRPASGHFDHPAGDSVEHVAIVGDEHQGSRVAVQPALEPLHGSGVQVVGRFIQQQHVRARDQG